MPDKDERFVVDDINDDVKAAYAQVTAEADKAPAPPAAEPPPVENASLERVRDEHGRFAKAKAEGDPETVPATEPAPEIKPPAVESPRAPVVEPSAPAEAPPTGSRTAPPPGWSVTAKSQWDKLSADVRDAVVKREAEINSGFEAYKGIKPYAEMARQSGTTLSDALDRYVGMEQALRQDPARGLIEIVSNMGLDRASAVHLFQSLAAHLGGTQNSGASQNGATSGHVPQNGAADPDLEALLRPILQPALQPLMREVDELRSHFARQTAADQSRQVMSAQSAVEQFTNDPKNRYFANVEETVSRLLESGMVARTGNMTADLQAAYEHACQLHPEVREALFNERLQSIEDRKAAEAKVATDKAREVAAKARTASRSISGSPTPGTSPATRHDGPAIDDIEDDVRRAYALLA